MEGISITTAYFMSRVQNTENTVPNQEINGDCETVGQSTTCMNKSNIYDDLGGLFAQAPNEDFPSRMSNSTPWNENNERQEFGVGSAISESASMGNNQNTTHLSSTDPECDLYSGKWIPDLEGPTYKNDTCPILSQPQNCQGNGRPDQGYENWRWKPNGCSMPRFDPRSFLQLMRGKVIAFAGDSIARNHMESLMCSLMQVEAARNRGNRKMQRWYFPQHSVTVIRIWSAWLVSTTREVPEPLPAGVTPLHLDHADEALMEFIPKFDVLVISSGHWYPRKTAYFIQGKLVGGQGWWEKKHSFKYDSTAAFAIAMQTALDAVASHLDYRGLTIFRTYTPDHYEGGQWNTGGSCTGKTAPLTDSELPNDPYTQVMRQHQLNAFHKTQLNITNNSKLRLMDITPVFSYRADGHPGPYRSQDPNKQTKRDQNGRPPPQDCLHWCMPGPIDTWNEFLFEILKLELQ